MTASGGVAGSVEQLTLREFAVNAQGHSLRATGALSLPGVAKGAPQSAGYKGSVALNGQTLEGSVDAKLDGQPNITADLRANVLDLDKIGGSGGGAPRAPARGQPAAGAQPIDTAALRSVDGSFKLVAATLISAPLRIGNADLAATLEGRRAHHLALQGRALWRLAGRCRAWSTAASRRSPSTSRAMPTASISARCCAAPSGTNQFGGAVKVTIDGRLNANGITVHGQRRDLRPDQEFDGGWRAARRSHLRRRRQGAAGAGSALRPARSAA